MIGIWSKDAGSARRTHARRHRPRSGHRAHRHLRPPHHRPRRSRRRRVRVLLRVHPRTAASSRTAPSSPGSAPASRSRSTPTPASSRRTCARARRSPATRSSWTTTSTTSTPSATPAVSSPTCTSSSPRTWASSPTPPSDKSLKLRLAFEASPFGLLVEKAGGKTSDGVTGGSVLDVKITQVDQRTALCIGSANEVDRFNSFVLGK